MIFARQRIKRPAVPAPTEQEPRARGEFQRAAPCEYPVGNDPIPVPPRGHQPPAILARAENVPASEIPERHRDGRGSRIAFRIRRARNFAQFRKSALAIRRSDRLCRGERLRDSNRLPATGFLGLRPRAPRGRCREAMVPQPKSSPISAKVACRGRLPETAAQTDGAERAKAPDYLMQPRYQPAKKKGLKNQ